MQLSQRAKIFSPFAALKGFEEAIDEKVQVYVEKRELSDEEQDALEAALSKLHDLTKNLRAAKENRVIATVSFFVPSNAVPFTIAMGLLLLVYCLCGNCIIPNLKSRFHTLRASSIG